MFQNKRFITRGVDKSIPPEIQILIWNSIDSMSIEKDYIQFFTIEVFSEFIAIEHKQEVPEYKNMFYILGNFENYFKDKTEINIFVIDDGMYSTMLLSNEY